MRCGSRDSDAVAKQVPQSAKLSTVILEITLRNKGCIQDQKATVMSQDQCFIPRMTPKIEKRIHQNLNGKETNLIHQRKDLV